MNPKFSVIVPAYNAEKYIDECICSVEKQTFNDYELIVVDDGSLDETVHRCSFYISRLPHMRIVRTQNQGPLLARREGAAAAKGDYLIFLDADDMLASGTLAFCEKVLREKSIDILVFGIIKGQEFPESMHNAILDEGYCFDEFREEVLRGHSNSLCGKAIKRSLFDFDVDYNPYRGMSHGEDLFQLLPVVDKAKNVYRLEQSLYFYRINDVQGTSTFRPNQIEDIKQVWGRLCFYGEKWNNENLPLIGMIDDIFFLLKIASVSSKKSEERREIYEVIRKELLDSVRVKMRDRIRIATKQRVVLDLLSFRAYRLLDMLLQCRHRAFKS